MAVGQREAVSSRSDALSFRPASLEIVEVHQTLAVLVPKQHSIANPNTYYAGPESDLTENFNASFSGSPDDSDLPPNSADTMR
jgi:hypothetical protein